MNGVKFSTTVLLSALLLGCNNPNKNNKDNSGKIEITPFIESSVILFDTTSIKTMAKEVGEGTLHEYQSIRGHEYFLNEVQFNEYKKLVQAMLKDPNAKLYQFGELTKPGQISKKFTITNDSVEQEQFDKDGNSFTVKVPGVTDSTWAVDGIRQIDFFETWFYDSKTNMIDKQLLGYSVITTDPIKNFERELFSVFVNDEAFIKFKKYKRW